MKSWVHSVAFLSFFLAGCGRLIDWSDETFKQSDKHQDYRTPSRAYIRSLRVYDQFNTVAMFDSLWLSDAVRTFYADRFAAKHGRDEDAKKVFLRRQLKENDHVIAFYILSLNSVPLGMKQTDWSLFLEIDGKKCAAKEIKSVDIPPEYTLLFGRLYNNFKTPYRVRFNRLDEDGHSIITENTKEIALCFSNAQYYARSVWSLQKAVCKGHKKAAKKNKKKTR